MFARLSHFFLPQESNNYRARLLHHSSLSFFIGLVLITQLFLSSFLLAKPDVLGFASQISPEKIVELTNQERAKAGVEPLKINPLLNESAQRKAGDMFAFDYWAHNSPSGRDPWSFFKEVGYQYLYAGENLARDFASPEAVVAAWMASPTHRDNLLNPKYQEIGISVVDGTLNGVPTTLVVQHFGTPVGARSQIASGTSSQTMVKLTPTPTMPAQSFGVLSPTPIPQTAINKSQPPQAVLAQAKGTEKRLISPFSLTKGFYFGLLIFLLSVVVLDGLAAQRRDVWRLTGRSLAHFLFLGIAILIVLFSGQGAIL